MTDDYYPQTLTRTEIYRLVYWCDKHVARLDFLTRADAERHKEQVASWSIAQPRIDAITLYKDETGRYWGIDEFADNEWHPRSEHPVHDCESVRQRIGRLKALEELAAQAQELDMGY